MHKLHITKSKDTVHHRRLFYYTKTTHNLTRNEHIQSIFRLIYTDKLISIIILHARYLFLKRTINIQTDKSQVTK